MPSTVSTDLLRLDVDAARELLAALRSGADALGRDRAVLAGLLDDAGALLGRDRGDPLVSVDAARARLDDLALDLGRRLATVDAMTADARAVDALTARLLDPVGALGPAGRLALEQRRRRLVLRLLGGDEALTARVVAAMTGSAGFEEAAREVLSAVIHEERIREVMRERGLHPAAARALIARHDAEAASLVDRGYEPVVAAAIVAVADDFGLDVEVLAARALSRDVTIGEATGDALVAGALGLTLDEFDALAGLRAHFTVFDAATGSAPDGRVSIADLAFVVAESCLFTDAQVLAAQLLLANPLLVNRLDTAAANDDIFGDDADAAPGGFGSLRPGDGLVAEADLRAFARKAQLHAVLGDYADRIDIADDPGGVVDGYRSEADFRSFLAATPDLPPPVVAAAEAMLDAGWFDESWWQEHKGEIAMGAALVAGGVVVIASAGTASVLLVGTAGAAAAGTATLAINLRTDDGAFDDVFTNSVSGFLVGMSTHSFAGGITQASASSSAAARLSGIVDATSGGTGVVLTGAVDLLLPDDWEEPVKDWAEPINTAASMAGALRGAGEWAEATGYVAIDDQTVTPGEVDG